MTIIQKTVLLSLTLVLVSCGSHPHRAAHSTGQSNDTLKYYSTGAPMAEEIPVRLEKHGDVRIDPYYWMNQRDQPKVLDYLNAERDYAAKVMKPYEKAREKILAEMQNRMKPDESDYPAKEGDYYYYFRYEAGKEYKLYCRKYKNLAAKEEVYLNGNDLYSGNGYFSIVSVQNSTDHGLIGYAVDTVGRRIYTLKFKDLKTGKMLSDEIPEVTPNFVWANDNQTLFYAKQNPQTLRSEKIFRHVLGTSVSRDVLVYEEKDETFEVGVSKSLNQKEIVIDSVAKLSTEARVISADHPQNSPQLFSPREAKVEYTIRHGGDRYYIYTNWNAENYRIMEAPLDKTEREYWKEVIPHRQDAYLRSLLVMKNWLVLEVRKNGLKQIEIIDRKTLKPHAIQFKDAAYVVEIGDNYEYESSQVRVEYNSPATPVTIYDIQLKNFTLIKRKQWAVLGGFKSENYQVERIFVQNGDVKIPVTLVYRKDTKKNAKTPLRIYGYGAYGISMEPDFSSSILSLLDRGFIEATAHVRGGGEMGRSWYEGGRTFNRKNTVNDFVAVTRALHKKGYSSPAHTYATGGSAGGLLMGTLVNEHPELYHGVIAAVPFVDIVTTMLDTSIPLTTDEYDIWGNPEKKEDYEYMKSYSPYDQVAKQAYPHILVTTGYHDSQVQYWEPAKWVAKLRKNKTDSNLLLFKIDMESGHSGQAGRLSRLANQANWYSFLLMLEKKL